MLAHRALATVTRRALPGELSFPSPTAPVERPQSLVDGDTGYGARGPVAECRLRRLDDGLYEYSPKKGAAFTVTAAALVRRLVALLPPARRHLTSFHGAYAPNAHLRAVITQPLPQPTTSSSRKTGAAPKPKRPRLDWAQLHQRTFGIDVLLCPCGGRRSIRRLHSTRSQAEARLLELGVALPSSVLPPATAPPQLLLAM